MGIFILILALYIVYILLCRQLNLWAVKNDKDSVFIVNRPVLWFIPVLGFCLVMTYVISVLYYRWILTDAGKWFVSENN